MTPRLEALSDSAAPAASLSTFQKLQSALGVVPNLHRTLGHSPPALEGYVALAGALARGQLDARLRESIAVATAGLNRCGYCASAHTVLGRGAGLDDEELAHNLEGASSDPRTRVALTLARELVDQRGDVSDPTLREVREAGFTDAEIVEIVLHVGMNITTNLFNVFARTEIDFPEVKIPAASSS